MKKAIQKMWTEAKAAPEKWLSYVMMIVLFGAAFLLPVYAVKYQAVQSSGGGTAEEISDVHMENRTESKCKEISDEENTAENNEDMSETVSGEEGFDGDTIVIDPGHGGFDGGMTGSTGITEKVLNLSYAKKLKILLEEEGYHVVLTRETEEGLYDPGASNKKAQDMQRRCAIIEKEEPLLTVSIHQNSYPDDVSVCGPQVFYYEHSEEGEKLAACIQNSMNEQLSVARPRKIKGNDSYYILKNSGSVTVLVEVGFLTNPEEELLLQQEEYQEKAARAICDGVLQYLRESEDDL